MIGERERVRVAWSVYALFIMPFLLMGGGSKKRPKSLRLGPILTAQDCRSVVKSLNTYLCGKQTSWRATVRSCPHSVRKSTRAKRKGQNVFKWTESLSPVVAASVLLEKGKKAQRNFTFAGIETTCYYDNKKRGIKATHRISGGPVTLKLTADGRMSAYPVAWPKDFLVTTVYEKKGASCKMIRKIPINPFLIFPIKPVDKE